MGIGDGMLVGAGDVLVNERRRPQDNAALGTRKPAGLLSREMNGRDSKGRRKDGLASTVSTVVIQKQRAGQEKRHKKSGFGF